MEQKKSCQYCKMEIDAAAVKCPYCREWLNKLSLSFKNPYLSSLLFILLLLFLMKAGTYYILKVKFPFKDLVSLNTASKVQLSNAKLVKDKKSFYITGEIENKESFEWSSVEVVATLNRKKGFFLVGNIISNLRPNEKRPFQIEASCGQETIDPSEITDFTLKIESGNAFIPVKD